METSLPFLLWIKVTTRSTGTTPAVHVHGRIAISWGTTSKHDKAEMHQDLDRRQLEGTSNARAGACRDVMT